MSTESERTLRSRREFLGAAALGVGLGAAATASLAADRPAAAAAAATATAATTTTAAAGATAAVAATPSASASALKVVRVQAFPLSYPGEFAYGRVRKPNQEGATYFEVETASGLIGHGISAI